VPIKDADEHQLARGHTYQCVFAKASLSTSVAALQPDQTASEWFCQLSGQVEQETG
jgi:hypothetical protein